MILGETSFIWQISAFLFLYEPIWYFNFPNRKIVLLGNTGWSSFFQAYFRDSDIFIFFLCDSGTFLLTFKMKQILLIKNCFFITKVKKLKKWKLLMENGMLIASIRHLSSREKNGKFFLKSDSTPNRFLNLCLKKPC